MPDHSPETIAQKAKELRDRLEQEGTQTGDGKFTRELILSVSGNYPPTVDEAYLRVAQRVLNGETYASNSMLSQAVRMEIIEMERQRRIGPRKQSGPAKGGGPSV